MLENLFPDMPLFDKKAGKSVTDRLNMGRLYIFNIFGAAGVLLFFAVLKLFGIHILPGKYQTLAFLTTVFIFLLSAAAVLFTTRTRRTDLFDKVCYAYLFVFSAILYNFAFKATSDAAAIVFYWIVMIVIGCLPVLRPEAFLAVWAIDLIPAVILAWVRGFPAATNTALVTIGIMGLGLSLALYSNTIRKLDYKLRLDSALSEAETDPMTLLLNRRGLDRRTENIWPY